MNDYLVPHSKSEEIHQEFAVEREETEAGVLVSPGQVFLFILRISTLS